MKKSVQRTSVAPAVDAPFVRVAQIAHRIPAGRDTSLHIIAHAENTMCRRPSEGAIATMTREQAKRFV
eukprot:9473053-Pyramimonas_sp.AAC.2